MPRPLAAASLGTDVYWDTARAAAAHHTAIWWLHDAADYAALEQAARALCGIVLPDLTGDSARACAAAIRDCYEAYDSAQARVRSWELDALAPELARLRAAHARAREAWLPEGAPGCEEGYEAFFRHSLFLHSPGWRRPVQKCWRNPARLAGLWRYHRACFAHTQQGAVLPAVRCLFWAGLAGHDYKSRLQAEIWLARYWVGLQRARVRHLFF